MRTIARVRLVSAGGNWNKNLKDNSKLWKQLKRAQVAQAQYKRIGYEDI